MQEEVNKNLVDYYHDEANKKEEAKDYDGALAEYDKAIAIGASNVPVSYLHKAAIYHQMGDDKSVLECLNKAIAIDENFAHAYLNRALYYRHNKNFEAAQKDYERAMELQPAVLNIVLFNEEDIYVYGEFVEATPPEKEMEGVDKSLYDIVYNKLLGTLFFNIYLSPKMGEGIYHDTNLTVHIEDIPYFADYCRKNPEAVCDLYYNEELMTVLYKQAKADYLYRVNVLMEAPGAL